MITIRHIRLRSVTADRTFGADIAFSDGLNVIQADNTSGKSTALMAIIYGLGLERSLTSKLDVPLPYAMRDRIEVAKDQGYEPVLESHVALEIRNSRGAVITVRREIPQEGKAGLVRTWGCSIDQVDGSQGQQKDFFLHDKGSAVNEDGFHHFLARFIGWDLPLVPYYNGDERPLYIETIFPMFFVEQKRGWSAIQGPLPTFFGVQDLPRRVMEFVLDLDAGKARRERSELQKELLLAVTKYKAIRKEIVSGSDALVRIEGLPNEPTASFGQDSPVQLAIYYDEEWRALSAVAAKVEKRIADFDQSEFVAVEDASKELDEKLGAAEESLAELSARVPTMRHEYQLALSEKRAFEDRVAALSLDLQRNIDAKKLQDLGSILGMASSEHTCPTCQQDVSTELLPAVSRVAMGLDDNIAFIRSQLELYRSMLGSISETLHRIKVQHQSLLDQQKELRAHVRALKRDLLRPNPGTSRAELEEIVRLQARLERWVAQQERVDGAVSGLRAIAREWADVKKKLAEVGSGALTEQDKKKERLLQAILQRLLKSFHFSSFKIDGFTLSSEDFRPQVRAAAKDGEQIVKDITFEASASDVVRLKWSYILSLLELSKHVQTNHIGFAVFDEPGQQQMDENDLAAFLAESALVASKGRQVLISTSEVLSRVEAALDGREAKLHAFGGYILQPLPA
ncbi:AAA family ATPase [Paracoccus sp. KR1-242]|uniref:AAA family ATPase n=1 Tax=Paracoccus sp. KR1-242 TaxID=3410028 RepID=UPI003BFC5FAF